jgi:hypothetical protein
MSQQWEQLFEELKGEAADLLKGELGKLLTEAKADTDGFVRRQAEKTELYLNQLAAGRISEQQAQSYLQDIKDLTALQELKMSVAAKASAQRLVKGIEDLILDRLFSLLTKL